MPIPRFLWANKPEGIHVETTKIFLPKFAALDTNWPPSIVGELYANFHVIGIVLGMLLFGLLCGKLQVYTMRVNSYYRVLLYSIILFAIFREVRGDFATITSLLLMQLIIFSTLGKFAFKKRGPRSDKEMPVGRSATTWPRGFDENRN
jgi:oligosaccharide repeat unit polymerase